jgi:hypothetical protein
VGWGALDVHFYVPACFLALTLLLFLHLELQSHLVAALSDQTI